MISIKAAVRAALAPAVRLAGIQSLDDLAVILALNVAALAIAALGSELVQALL